MSRVIVPGCTMIMIGNRDLVIFRRRRRFDGGKTAAGCMPRAHQHGGDRHENIAQGGEHRALTVFEPSRNYTPERYKSNAQFVIQARDHAIAPH